MNFFIGQPVKKVRGDARNNGITGRVRGLNDGWLMVQIDSPGVLRHSERTAVAGGTYPSRAEQWEPILPSGAQPSEFTTLHDLLNSLEGVCV